MKLMIVDDEYLAANALAASYDWAARGFDCVEVYYDGEAAWRSLQDGKTDLLLCDIEMPFLDGLALQKRIVEKQIATRTVLLTCHADFRYAQQALRLGVTDYLLKPVDEKELSEVVSEAARELQSRRMKQPQPPGGYTRPIQEACAYIREHLSEDISREEVARAVYLNPDYLSRIFKKELNVSLSHYILEEKMRLAQILLQTTDLSVTEVGGRVGFSNMSAFSYAFRRSTGRTPTSYRRGE